MPRMGVSQLLDNSLWNIQLIRQYQAEVRQKRLDVIDARLPVVSDDDVEWLITLDDYEREECYRLLKHGKEVRKYVAQYMKFRVEAGNDLATFAREAWVHTGENTDYLGNWHIKLMCRKLQDITEGKQKIKRLAIAIPPGTSKPLSVGSMVLMGDHSLKRLGDVQVGDKVIAADGLPHAVTAVHEQGKLPTLRITRKDGTTVVSAHDHPFFISTTPWHFKYIQAKDLHVGHVACCRTPTAELQNITAIEPGEDTECRCLTVEDQPSFVANGFVVHNSYHVSVVWPAWSWINRPDMRFLSAGHAKTLTEGFARRSMNLMQSDWFQRRFGRGSGYPEWSWVQKSVSNYSNDAGGWRISTTPGGGATGLHPDVFLCLPAEQKIRTSAGLIPIGDVVEKRMNVTVESYNGTGIEYRPITNYWKNPGAGRKLLKFTLSDGHQFTVTENHSVYTSNHGKLAAEALKLGMRIRTICPECLGCHDCALESATVKSIEELPARETVYNIEVQGNHNYFAGTVLVANCDDPLDASDAESFSLARLKYVNNWYSSTITTRGVSRDVQHVITMQRLAIMDLIGYVLKQAEADPELDVETLCFPMKYEPNHPNVTESDPRTEEGELLWPSLFTEQKVASTWKKLATAGPHRPAGQLQQRPTAREGGVFKRVWFEQQLRMPSEIPQDIFDYGTAIRYWDLASTEGGGDYTAGALMALYDGIFYLLNVFYKQMGVQERDAKILQLAKKDSQAFQNYRIGVEQEGGSGGKTQTFYLAKQAPEYTWIVDRKAKGQTKMFRAESVAGAVSTETMVIVCRKDGEESTWNTDTLDQFSQAPDAENDDIMDAVSGARFKLSQNKEWGLVA